MRPGTHWDLEQAREFARREWAEGLETYLALGCGIWLIIVALAAVCWAAIRVLEHMP